MFSDNSFFCYHRGVKTPALICRHLGKTYDSGEGIFDFSFSVGMGSIHAFLGPNGSGKTTTFNIIVGLLPGFRGECLFFRDSQEILGDRYRHVGYLPEKAPLYDFLTVRQHLEFLFDLYSGDSRKKREGVDWAIERCGLKGVEKKFVGHLSKGFRQRVGVCGALIHRPLMMIFDEPFVGLDLESRALFRDLFMELKREGHSLIFSTHQLSEAQKICDELTVIKEGRMIYTGGMDQFLSRGQSSFPFFSKGNDFEEKLMRSLHL